MKDEKHQSFGRRTMAAVQLDDQNDGQEYEEITSDEVDTVVEQLERLVETVRSENIKSYLEDAINSIFFLVYTDDDSAEAA
jgi:N-dimethylarginine dimethylaminohydrolase